MCCGWSCRSRWTTSEIRRRHWNHNEYHYLRYFSELRLALPVVQEHQTSDLDRLSVRRRVPQLIKHGAVRVEPCPPVPPRIEDLQEQALVHVELGEDVPGVLRVGERLPADICPEVSQHGYLLSRRGRS